MNYTRVLLKVGVLHRKISLLLHLLVAHDLVLELQLQFQEFNLLLVLLNLVLQSTNGFLLTRIAHHSLAHSKLSIDVADVSHRQVASKIFNFSFKPLDLLDILVLLMG